MKHRRHRPLLLAFTPRFVARWRAAIRRELQAFVEDWERAGEQ